MILMTVLIGACQVTVRSGLSEAEANQIVVALDRAAVSATKTATPGGGSANYQVDVTTADTAMAMRVLETERLPRERQPGFEQLFGETVLLATPSEERARFVTATAGELSSTLEQLPGVVRARVHIALREPELALDSKLAATTAGVLLQHDGPKISETAVQELIASAIKGLDPSSVTVIQVRAERLETGGPSWTRVGPFTVSPRSARFLRLTLGGTLLLDILMALAVIALVRRRRQSRSETRAPRPRKSETATRD